MTIYVHVRKFVTFAMMGWTIYLLDIPVRIYRNIVCIPIGTD